MRTFHCDECDQLVFFENVTCLKCGHALAFLPDLADMGALVPAGDNLWRALAPEAEERTYRLCANYAEQNVCNWAVRAEDEHTLCESCRLTQVIPDLNRPGHHESWYKLEVAKRRLVYSLMMLRLPILNRIEDPERGLAFEFLADPTESDAKPVLTGHAGGVITINIAEADDAERERRRLAMHEPYRTLLGHFRHESGHYYWDRLIQDSPQIDRFRELFGDERADYGESLETHYRQGPPANWPDQFISSYASAHPWEDWAESWAHFLHMTDTLETAAATGLALQPRRRNVPTLKADPKLVERGSFDRMIAAWFPLTYLLNNLNRGLGLADGYPFVISNPAIEKLRFIHETVMAAGQRLAPTAAVSWFSRLGW
jgi:hypothetical protein